MDDFEKAVSDAPELLEIGAPKFPNRLDYVAAVAGLVPFVFSVHSSSSESSSHEVDGVVVEHAEHVHFKDFVAIGGGAIAIAFAIATVTLWKSTLPAKKAARMGATIALLVLGAYQLVVRGGLLT